MSKKTKYTDTELESLSQVYGRLNGQKKPAQKPVLEEWEPALSPEQKVVFYANERFQLVHGERFSGKTYCVGHKLVKHAWMHHNARVLIVTGVRRQATSGGVWSKIIDDILPEWEKNLDGFEYNPPRQTQEKDTICEIKNRFGGTSLLHLISIPHGGRLADRIRGIEASMIFVDELVGIGGEEYLTDLAQQLGRLTHIPIEEQQYVAATNPDGPSHWVYKKWWGYTDEEGVYRPPMKNSAQHHLSIGGNPSPRAQEYYRDVVIPLVSHDRVEYERLVEGKWVDRPSGAAIFRENFVPELHVIGDAADFLHPSTKYPIEIGYDIGDVNHGVAFLQQRFTAEKTVWTVFDEIVLTDRRVSIEQLVPKILAKMQYWCEEEDFRFTFQHISDKSAFNRFRSSTGSYDHKQVEDISAKLLRQYPMLSQSIRMKECPKPSGSVAGRVKIVQSLLSNNALLVSGKCPRYIDALKNLASEKDDPFEPHRSPHLHIHDAVSYVLFYNGLGGEIAPKPMITPQITQCG